jgi:hypothetical protein
MTIIDSRPHGELVTVRRLNTLSLFALLLTFEGCSGENPNNLGTVHIGGQSATGGLTASGNSTGGNVATVGGATNTGSLGGGMTGQGGSTAIPAGGVTGTNIGGAPHTGGMGFGGGVSSGGNMGIGGAISGGAPNGGSTSIGGSATGGLAATGGAPTGGLAATTGGVSTGGLAATTGGSSPVGQGGSGGTQNPPVLDLRCSSDADCCVVADSCGMALWLVTLAQRPEMIAYLQSRATSSCPSCMAPQVQLACQSGQCAGTQVGSAWPPVGLSAPHCGTVSGTAAAINDAGTTQTVFGCK